MKTRSNCDSSNKPSCPLSSTPSPGGNEEVRILQNEESPSSIALRLCSSNLHSPITPHKTPLKRRINNTDVSGSPMKQMPPCETPEKLKNLNDDQITKLSETDQIELAMRESLKTTTCSPNNLLNLTEEEQLAEAINASLREHNLANEHLQEEEMTKAIELAIHEESNVMKEQDENQMLLAIEHSKSPYLVQTHGNGSDEDIQENTEIGSSGI